MIKHSAILKSDLTRRVTQLNEEIRREGNSKVKARLVEEQAAYKIVLRNLPIHQMVKAASMVTA